MISVSDDELFGFLSRSEIRTYKRLEMISHPDSIPNEIYFINQGLIRVIITDPAGSEHTIHFALENQFIADYSHFLLNKPSIYGLQALEETQLVVLPKATIEWGYSNLREGQKMGRLIAEHYFIYQDSRIQDMLARTPKERYDSITDIFPNIHNRVPQHMIASYLGISPVHLSRLKKTDYLKT